MRTIEDRFEFSRMVDAILDKNKERNNEFPRSREELADKLNMNSDTLESRFRKNASPFSPDEVRDILGVMPHRKLVNYLLRRSIFVGIERINETELENAEENLMFRAVDMTKEACDAMDAVKTALEDGEVCEKDIPRLRQELEKAESAMLQMRGLLNVMEKKLSEADTGCI